MVKYICEICKKEFKQKGHYNDHITKRKKPCVPKAIIITQESSILPQNPLILPQNPQNIYEKSKYMCNFCEKPFSRSDHLKRHLTKSCKIRKEETLEKEDIFKKLIEKMDNLEKQNKLLTDEIKILKENKNIKIINKNNGIITNNTINIIQHGKEDLSKIDNTVFLNAILKYTGAQIPSKIIEGIHFNDKYPEFKNIYISDINREKVMIHNGNEWILSPSQNITSNLLDKTLFYSENKYEEIETTINNIGKKRITRQLKVMKLMKDFDELDEVLNTDTDEEGRLLDSSEIERRKYLRKKSQEYIKLLLYNSRNNIH